MRAETKTEEFVKGGMLIGETVAKYPEIAPVMQAYGLHCIGCHVNPYESIEQGAMGHGMPKETFDEMMQEVNNEVKKFEAERENAPSMEEVQEKSGKVITLTSKAVSKVMEFMQAEDKPMGGLRVGAAPGGCSGFQYMLEFEEAPSEDDAVYEQGGLKIFINKQQMQLLHGVKIDYIEGLQGNGFKIENPNAKKTCGCGQSFH